MPIRDLKLSDPEFDEMQVAALRVRRCVEELESAMSEAERLGLVVELTPYLMPNWEDSKLDRHRLNVTIEKRESF